MEQEYDVIVVGAGVVGSSTAYHLVKNGVKRVLLLEQYHVLHTRGSSHGGSRCTRQFIPNYCEGLSKMTSFSVQMFAKLQRECGRTLYCPTEALIINSVSDPALQQTIHQLKSRALPITVLSSEQLNHRYSSQLCVPSNFIGLVEPTVLLLKISTIVAVFQDLFVRAGGELLDQQAVSEIVPGEKVTVRTSEGDYCSHRLVVTAGAWTPQLLSKLGLQLPIKVQKAEVFYWKIDNPEYFKPEVFPWVIFERGSEHYYVFPELEYPDMIKVYHRTYRDIEIDDRDRGGAGPDSQQKVVHFINKFLKGVTTTPAIFEPCVYSMTQDRLPIIDCVPSHPNIVFAAGMSGRGVMISPALGLLLTEMTLNKPPSFDLSSFRLAKFHKCKI